ncbi:PspC domain-containing protein [Fructobacillus cardui]|uniref:PspC domain-containing protein n=1 Tax=Fructobacillus cardui TaxID=2893170 RepID=UPI00200B7131|nr:PspC domain-containing protein [Fructobacillus cardui]MCK8628115.1 PspC domain-containing protein [Fructobacillus cardui]
MKITRSRNNRFIAGVLGGIAEYYNWNANILRTIFILVSLTPFPGILAYLILWMIMPDEQGPKNDDIIDGEIIE